MAKSKIENEERELGSEESTSMEKQAGADAAKKDDRSAEEVVVTSGSKKVKIHIIEEVDCLIACKPYKLTKGKDYQVPADVAAILCYGGKAYRL